MTTSDQVPGRFPVGIEGRPYVAQIDQYRRESLELFRQQADGGREFDEGSLNPQDLWRRSQIDWRYGTGVEFLDRGDVEDVDRQRFAYSRGINPWVEGGKLELLPLAELKYHPTSMLGVGKLVYAGENWHFMAEGVVRVKSGTSGGSWTMNTVTNGSSGVYDICTDGRWVYMAKGGSGIWRYDGTSTSPTATKINDVNVENLAFVRRRLMGWQSQNLYNVTNLSSTTAPSALSASLTTSASWACVGDAGDAILAGLNERVKSTIYRITIRDDATALSAPVPVADLPNGETVRCIVGYVGIVLLGTTQGIRLATLNGASLEYGPLVEVPGGVRDMSPHGSQVWFTWTENVEGDLAARSGVGRLDLTRFSRPLSPSYASDLLASTYWLGQESSSVVKTPFELAFVLGDEGGTQGGVWVEGTNKAASGEIVSGTVTFGVVDPKIPEKLIVRMEPLPAGASVTASILDAADNSVIVSGSVSTTNATELEVNLSTVPANLPDGIRVKLALTRANDTTPSPVITRWTLLANPIPRRGERFIVPLVLRSRVTDNNGQVYELGEPYAEFLALKAMEQTGEPVEYQEFGQTYRAFIDAIQFGPELQYGPSGKPEGLCLVSLRVFE